MARVDRRRRDDPAGRRRPHRPRRAARRLGGVRRPAAPDRVVLGRLQRHRHRLQHGRDRGDPARARRPVVLGLRGGGAVHRHRDVPRHARTTRSPTRTRSSSRRTSSSAARRRPGCWSRAASCSATGCRTCPAAGRSPTSTTPSTPTCPSPSTARRAARRRSSSRSGPGLVFQLKQAVGVETIRAAEERFLSRAVAAWSEEPCDRDPRQPRCRPALDRVVRRTRSVGQLPAPQLRGRPAQRPVRHPVARRLLVRRALRPPAAGHRHRAQPRVRARDHRRLRGDQARLGAGELQLLPLRRRRRLHRRGRASWSRATAGGCSATTGSTPRPASGRTATAWSSRRCGCGDHVRRAGDARADLAAGRRRVAARPAPRRRREDPGRGAGAGPHSPDLAQRGLRAPALVRPAGRRPSTS